jgi:hypothetical protein
LLKGELRKIPSLTEAEREWMYGIMVRHYAEVHWEAFLCDLSEKDGILLLVDQKGEIQGFSTYRFMHTRYAGEELVALFSGDTIIDRDHWGTPTLFSTFGRLLHALIHENRGKKTYWFLITKGYRTYLMLPLFFKEFFPRHDQETPPYEKGLIEHLAAGKYGAQFDRERGIIAAGSYFLKGEFAETPEARLRNHHVRFFLERNPGYLNGEELACVCAIHPENFRKRTRMLVRP